MIKPVEYLPREKKIYQNSRNVRFFSKIIFFFTKVEKGEQHEILCNLKTILEREIK